MVAPAETNPPERLVDARVSTSDARSRRAVFIFAVVAVAAVVVIMALAADLSFQGDEWAYIVDRRLTFESMLQPHNGHLVFFHVLVYRGMVELLGVGSYLPFLAVLMAGHVAMATGVFALMRRVVSIEAALAAAILLLCLGSGFDNLVWAFQMGFVGSAALGVWALVVARRSALAAVLLTVSVCTVGVGLFFILPLAVLIKRKAWVLLPIATYAAWFMAFERASVPLPTLSQVGTYAVSLMGSMIGGAAGVGILPGLILTAALLAGLVIERKTVSMFVAAGVLGLVSMTVILTITRGHFGPDQAGAPRYIYVALPFVLMTLTALRRVRRGFWAAAFAIALVLNIWALPRGVAIYHAFLNYDRSIPLEQRLAPFR